MKRAMTLPLILGVIGAIASIASATTDERGESVARGFHILDVTVGFGIWFAIGLIVAQGYYKLRSRNPKTPAEPQSIGRSS